MKHDLVSIVVTTKNEAKNIKNCLRSIQCQTWSNTEIILVDNNSTDNTTKFARKYTDKIYNFGPERSAQRNLGMAEKSVGKYLMYIDADMILSPRLVEACIDYIRKKNFDALYIDEYVLGKHLFSRARNFERSFYSGSVIDAARFFKREIFINSGGFDEIIFKEGSGEDWDLDKSIRKIGGKIGLLPKEYDFQYGYNKSVEFSDLIESLGGVYSEKMACIYHNESQLKIKNYLKKKIYYAKGFDGYIQKWGKDDSDIKMQLGFKYRFVGVFIEKSKWKKIFNEPLLFLMMYYLRIIVGIAYLISLKK